MSHGDDYFEGERRPNGETVVRPPFCRGVIDSQFPPRGCLNRTKHASGYCALHRPSAPQETEAPRD